MKTKGGQRGDCDGKKLNAEGTEVGHRRHEEDRGTGQIGNRGWQDSWVRGNGKAIAMVLAGNILLALFVAAAKWRCAATELRRVMPSRSEVDGSPIIPGQAAKNPADSPPEFRRASLRPESRGENTRPDENSQVLL
jgi:hypothetical protein